jgi:hypothetical protein
MLCNTSELHLICCRLFAKSEEDYAVHPCEKTPGHLCPSHRRLDGRGYVVLYTNPRGSTSYGEEFGNLIHHAYPGDDFHDLNSGVDAMLAKGYINSSYVEDSPHHRLVRQTPEARGGEGESMRSPAAGHAAMEPADHSGSGWACVGLDRQGSLGSPRVVASSAPRSNYQGSSLA